MLAAIIHKGQLKAERGLTTVALPAVYRHLPSASPAPLSALGAPGGRFQAPWRV